MSTVPAWIITRRHTGTVLGRRTAVVHYLSSFPANANDDHGHSWQRRPWGALLFDEETAQEHADRLTARSGIRITGATFIAVRDPLGRRTVPRSKLDQGKTRRAPRWFM